MRSPLQHTAILFFSHLKKQQANDKKIHSLKAVNKKISSLFIRKSLKTAQKSGYPVYWIDSNQQQGDTFGERLANAYQWLFDKGYQKVIAIGNDCLTLTVEDVYQAATSLESNKSVLGPSKDGGVYLLGLCKEQFSKQTFAELPWTTCTLLAALKSHLKDVQFLSFKRSVNYREDLVAEITGDALCQWVKKRILAILAVLQHSNYANYSFSRPHLPFLAKEYLRGPPIRLHS